MIIIFMLILITSVFLFIRTQKRKYKIKEFGRTLLMKNIYNIQN